MNEKLKRVVKALDDLKLTDIRIFDFRTFSPHFDFQVIATGNSERQVGASVKHLYDSLPEYNLTKIEGAAEARWILFDLGDIIISVMHRDEREYYQLEKLFVQHDEILVKDLIDGI
ncbi:MAG: ribosome silencing factor [Candidatus Izemoplasmatales bacterium]|jgi:ribosome-associated protein|nr:ribosome silencing factor [Candidatus Izemoplasmatales bacterium]MDD3865373.1 ribosome silencing factor [Candidatus Izemoplasmatales bacterium]